MRLRHMHTWSSSGTCMMVRMLSVCPWLTLRSSRSLSYTLWGYTEWDKHYTRCWSQSTVTTEYTL